MFKYLYFILAIVLYAIAIPFLILLSFKKKYRQSIPSRFFLIKNPPLSSDGLYFHICSLGEAKSIEPIIENFDKKILRFSVITNTGFNQIQRYTKESRYLPYEIFLPFWIKKQKALVVVEAELWYMLFLTAKAKGAKTFLINARISQKSYSKYLKFKWFYKNIFENIDYIYAQSEDDKIRLESLGAKNIKVIGNIKLFKLPEINKKYLKERDLIICAASTHEGEESLIIKAFLNLRKKESKTQLIVVPRHPERFAKIDKLLANIANENNLSYNKITQSMNLNSDIILIDKLGELVNIYAVSDVVILGGAFEKIGGHNAAEAAKFNCKIISGEHYFNQKDIFNAIDGIKIVKNSDLDSALLNYKNIKNAKIKAKTNLDELIKDLKSVL